MKASSIRLDQETYHRLRQEAEKFKVDVREMLEISVEVGGARLTQADAVDAKGRRLPGKQAKRKRPRAP